MSGCQSSSIDIVICCSNEPLDLVRSVVIALKTKCKSNQRVIISSNGETKYHSLRCDGLVDVCLHEPTNLGIAALRNTGFSICKASYVLFLDAHMILQDWSETLPIVLEYLRLNSDIGILTGIYESVGLGKGIAARQVLYEAFSNKGNLTKITTTKEKWFTVTGGISIYRSAVLKAIGGFPESYARSSCEDVFLQLRAEQQGWFLVVHPDLQAVHVHPMDLKKFYVTCIIRNARGSAKLFLSMVSGDCKFRVTGYVCEIPSWGLLFFASLISLVTSRKRNASVTLLLSVVLLLRRFQMIWRISKNKPEVSIHAFLGYTLVV